MSVDVAVTVSPNGVLLTMNGPPGAQGSVGQTGGAIPVPYAFSTTTTAADPGSGNARLNQATQNTATAAYISDVGADTATWGPIFAQIAAVTSATKGYLRVAKSNDATKWLLFKITALTNNSTYYTLAISEIASSAASPFANGDALTFHFTTNGDMGSVTTPPFNRIINGDQRLDQRNSGASVTVAVNSSKYITDRWKIGNSTPTATATGQQIPVNWSGVRSRSVLRYKVGTPQSSLGVNDNVSITQIVEGVNISDLGWGTSNAQPVYVDFWASASVTGSYSVALYNGATTRSFVHTVSLTANTPTRVSFAVPGDTGGTWTSDNSAGLALGIYMACGTTYQTTTVDAWQAGIFVATSAQINLAATANATFDITEVQIVNSPTQISFEYLEYSAQLARCQRYFCSRALSSMIAINTTSMAGPVGWAAKMRVIPTVVISNAGVVNNIRTTSNGVVVSISPTAVGASVDGVAYIGTSGAVLTTGFSFDFQLTADSDF